MRTMAKKSVELNSPQVFNPDAEWAQQLARNRAGHLTGGQRNVVLIGAVGSSLGVVVIVLIALSVGGAIFTSGRLNAFTLLTFVLFLLSFGYLGLTAWFNARVFVPDLLSKQPVQQARGKLEIKMASRERQLLPFSYIVAGYSFAPFEVPYEVPMEKGRKYVVYYAQHSRIFLNIEPVDYEGRE